MKKKIISVTAMLLLVGTAAGCGAGADTTPVTVNTTKDVETTVQETTEYNPLEKLEKIDFDGKIYRVISSESFFFSPYDVEAENGEILNDTAYARNRYVEEEYNIVMDYNMLSGGGAEPINALIASILAGDNSYSLGNVHCYLGLSKFISDGYAYDWNELPYVDFEQNWWNQSFNKELKIGDIIPCAAGDYVYFNSGCIYFNKDLLDKYALENPYELVYDGKWTWEKLSEMSVKVVSDIYGNGEMNELDQYGYSIINNHRTIPVTYSCGIFTSNFDENGYPSLDNMISEKMFNIVEMYYKLLFENKGMLITTSDELKPFRDGRVLFLHYVTQNIKALRDLELEFGILPQPKYDEEQENYASFSQSNVLVIPANVDDPEFIGLITEALTIYSSMYVMPALYDETFNNKYLRDEDSVNMFEIIKDSLVYDKLYNYSEDTSISYFLRNLMQQKSTDLMSYYQANAAKIENQLIEFYDKVLNK
nr:extracellular solute-binding protein [Clostridia bacterium]